MTTTMVETGSGALVAAWIDTHRDQHTEVEWALRSDVEPAPMVDYLGFAAIVCKLGGWELHWSPVTPDEADDSWPADITHATRLAIDPSSGEFVHVADAARHILQLETGSLLDFLLDIHPGDGTVPTTDDVLAAINTHLIGGN
jgi:hypothetical protein